MTSQEPCWSCDGDGTIWDDVYDGVDSTPTQFPCSICGGRGTLDRWAPDAEDGGW